MKTVGIIVGVGALAGLVAFGLGYGEEALEGDYWRNEYHRLRASRDGRVAQACGRRNPHERPTSPRKR